MGTLYALYLNFQSQAPSSIQYTNIGNCAGILSLLNDFTAYSTTAGVSTTSIYFDTKPTDNAPIILNKLRNISNINLNVLNLLDNTTFNSTNNTTINSYTDYICILTFTQV